MAWIKIDWPESQNLLDLVEEKGYYDNVIAANESGSYLVNEDWLEEVHSQYK